MNLDKFSITIQNQELFLPYISEIHQLSFTKDGITNTTTFATYSSNTMLTYKPNMKDKHSLITLQV